MCDVCVLVVWLLVISLFSVKLNLLEGHNNCLSLLKMNDVNLNSEIEVLGSQCNEALEACSHHHISLASKYPQQDSTSTLQ